MWCYRHVLELKFSLMLVTSPGSDLFAQRSNRVECMEEVWSCNWYRTIARTCLKDFNGSPTTVSFTVPCRLEMHPAIKLGGVIEKWLPAGKFSIINAHKSLPPTNFIKHSKEHAKNSIYDRQHTNNSPGVFMFCILSGSSFSEKSIFKLLRLTIFWP